MPHPTRLTDEQLLADCEVTRQRRSGPGGQHRNKVETAIRILHRPTEISAQASERRSQEENRKQALNRLRIELALKVRSGEPIAPSDLWKSRVKGKKIAVNPRHPNFAPLLAEALDCLAAHRWDHKTAAEALEVSASQLIKFLKLEPAAFQQFNKVRSEQGLRTLV